VSGSQRPKKLSFGVVSCSGQPAGASVGASIVVDRREEGKEGEDLHHAALRLGDGRDANLKAQITE